MAWSIRMCRVLTSLEVNVNCWFCKESGQGDSKVKTLVSLTVSLCCTKNCHLKIMYNFQDKWCGDLVIFVLHIWQQPDTVTYMKKRTALFPAGEGYSVLVLVRGSGMGKGEVYPALALGRGGGTLSWSWLGYCPSPGKGGGAGGPCSALDWQQGGGGAGQGVHLPYPGSCQGARWGGSEGTLSWLRLGYSSPLPPSPSGEQTENITFLLTSYAGGNKMRKPDRKLVGSMASFCTRNVNLLKRGDIAQDYYLQYKVIVVECINWCLYPNGSLPQHGKCPVRCCTSHFSGTTTDLQFMEPSIPEITSLQVPRIKPFPWISNNKEGNDAMVLVMWDNAKGWSGANAR